MGLNIDLIKKGIYYFTGKPKVTNNVKNNTVKELFCQRYWKDALDEGMVSNNNNKNSVSLHGYLNSINHHFINSPNPKALDEISPFTKMTPREMIFKTDMEFKSLNPIEKPLKVFRGIGEKPEFFSTYKFYQKGLNTQKGDIIDMKEYAYATSDINYAKCYIPDNKGILYEINIPEKARISLTGYGIQNEIVFPRSSRFECTGVEKGDITTIKLKYLLPDESFRTLI